MSKSKCQAPPDLQQECDALMAAYRAVCKSVLDKFGEEGPPDNPSDMVFVGLMLLFDVIDKLLAQGAEFHDDCPNQTRQDVVQAIVKIMGLVGDSYSEIDRGPFDGGPTTVH